DQPVEPAPRRAQPGGEDAAEFSLHRRPSPLGIVVPTDDVNRISLLDKTGERVKHLGKAVGGALQLPDAFLFAGSQSQLALLRGHLEGYLFAGARQQRDGDEIDDVSVEDQTPRLAAFAVGGVPVDEGSERFV